MKKPIQLLVIFLVLFGGATAQNITLSDDHGTIGPNDTVFYFGDINALIESHIFVTNTGNKAIDVSCVREEIYTVPGSSNYFCWDACFSPTIDSAGIQNIGAGATNKNSFSGDYEAFGNMGKSYIRYKFYDTLTPTNFATVLVEYNATGVGMEQNTKSPSIELNVYPNPATTHANISFDLNTSKEVQIVISDIIGNTVYLKEGELFPSGQNIIKVDMNEMNPGMYFAKVLVDNKIFTKKLYLR